jgi:hypothetical protein
MGEVKMAEIVDLPPHDRSAEWMPTAMFIGPYFDLDRDRERDRRAGVGRDHACARALIRLVESGHASAVRVRGGPYQFDPEVLRRDLEALGYRQLSPFPEAWRPPGSVPLGPQPRPPWELARVGMPEERLTTEQIGPHPGWTGIPKGAMGPGRT